MKYISSKAANDTSYFPKRNKKNRLSVSIWLSTTREKKPIKKKKSDFSLFLKKVLKLKIKSLYSFLQM